MSCITDSQCVIIRCGGQRCPLIILVIVLFLAWTAPICADPDPYALLRGVEASRAGIQSGRFVYRLRTKGSEPGLAEPLERNLTIEFQGAKLRCIQESRDLVISAPEVQRKKEVLRGINYDRSAFVRAGLGQWEDIAIRRVFDGSQVLSSCSEKGADVGEPPNPRTRGDAGFLFDPRSIGLNYGGRHWETLDYCLGYREADSVVCVGQESVGSHLAWHVTVAKTRAGSPDRIERHFWIGDQEGFPVYRFVLRTKDAVQSIVESEYQDPVASHVLPVRVRKQGKFIKDAPTIEKEIELLKGEYGKAMDPAAFTLAGLNLQLGATVTDTRLHQVVGYWNGSGLSKDYLEAIRLGTTAEQVKGARWTWTWVLSAIAALLLLLGALLLFRRRVQLLARP